MADVSGGVAKDLSKFIPNVCTNSPVPGIVTIIIITNWFTPSLSSCNDCDCSWVVIKYIETLLVGHAFCKDHCLKVNDLGYPTDLKQFLKSCGNGDCPVNPDAFTKSMKDHVDNVVKDLSEKIENGGEFRSSLDAQGKDAHMITKKVRFLWQRSKFRQFCSLQSRKWSRNH